MFRQGSQLLLIATILACPLMCSQGLCICAEQENASACCDDCESHCIRDDHPVENPSHPCDGPCEDCQCICGGATFNDSSQFELLQKISAEVDVFLCETVSSQPELLQLTRILSPDPFPDDHRATSGRTICCLNMTFLC